VRLVLSPQSLEDIEDIYAYSLSTWGAGQAELYRDRIFDALDLLMDHPEIGRIVAGYPLAVRMLRIEQYNAFYRVEDDTIRVLQLAHVSRNTLPELM
jgi:toxin ParE1/3/4